MKLPPSRKFYRFTAFSGFLLDSISQGKVFYSDPTQFNDPFDCDLKIQDDGLNISLLKALRKNLVLEAEGPYSIDPYSDWLRSRNPREVKGKEREAILESIELRLREKLSHYGVLCLSVKFTASLMWAHYADKHRGVCLEYDAREFADETGWDFNLHRVDYFRSNQIDLTTLHSAFVEKSNASQRKVEDAYFFTKSSAWSYEEEWRVIQVGKRMWLPPGLLTGVYFGLRCPNGVKTALIKMLASGECPPKFYNMQGYDGDEISEPSSLKAVRLSAKRESATFSKDISKLARANLSKWVEKVLDEDEG